MTSRHGKKTPSHNTCSLQSPHYPSLSKQDATQVECSRTKLVSVARATSTADVQSSLLLMQHIVSVHAA